MVYQISDLINLEKIQKLTDSFYKATGIPSAIIEPDGTVLTGSGWQRICTHFHRRHSHARRACIESDTRVSALIGKKHPYAIYRCPHGLIDAAAPIRVNGIHLANLFMGQFLFTGPDDQEIEIFRKRAAEYGFDEAAYIEALQEVPIIPEERVSCILDFLSELAQMLAQTGLGNLRQQQASEKLQMAHDEMEQRIEERTAALVEANEKLAYENFQRRQTEDQLKVLMAEVERANRDLEEFAYVVSHDLKAPLRGISSLSSWIEEDYESALDQEGRGYLLDLRNQTRLMNSLIDGILQYSKVGRVQPTPEPIDAGQMVNEIIETLSPPPGIRIIREDLPRIVYDRSHLYQIFQNLLENAIRYMGKPEGEIRIECRNLPGLLEFCVSDTGIGIEARHFDRIFKMFQTLGGIPANGVSTGIGLALVKRIVERHSGSLWVESERGAGSRFCFTLPIQEKGFGTQPHPAATVLIIDDNTEFSVVTEIMLKRSGEKVIKAVSEKSASDALKLHPEPVDLALLDLRMPQESPLRILQMLRKTRPEIKVVICTGSNEPELIDQLMKEGAVGVLYKPFRSSDLVRILNEHTTPKRPETT